MSNRMTGWSELRLEDVCRLRAGSGFKSELQGRSSGDYPFIKQSDMSLPQNGRFIVEATNWVDEGDLKTLKAKPHPAGTVVFGKIGEGLKRNRFRVLTRPTIIDNNMMGATPTLDVASDFFAYLIGQVDMGALSEGSALPYLRTEDLARVPILVPPIAEQRAIAGVLGALDDKIESNRRIGETFDELVVTEYKRIQSQTSVSRKLLGEIVGKGLGGVWGTDVEEPGSDFCVACLRGIDLAKIASGTLPEVPKRWISHAQYLKRSLSGPEIWIEGSGSFCGRSLLVEPQLQGLFERPICYSNFVKRLVPIDDPRLMVPSWLSLRAAYESGEVGQLRIGSAFPNLDLDGVLSAVVVTIPESAELDRLVNLALLMVNPLQIRESQRLVELRDALLPELLSGRLRVRDAEKVVEEAV